MFRKEAVITQAPTDVLCCVFGRWADLLAFSLLPRQKWQVEVHQLVGELQLPFHQISNAEWETCNFTLTEGTTHSVNNIPHERTGLCHTYVETMMLIYQNWSELNLVQLCIVASF